jgi:hypothetical protein
MMSPIPLLKKIISINHYNIKGEEGHEKERNEKTEWQLGVTQ